MASDWQILELGGRARVASKLNLHELTRPLRVVGSETSVFQVCEALAQGAALVPITDGPELVSTIDAAALEELGLSDVAGSTPTPRVSVRQICTMLPATAATTDLTGQEATDAMKRAREASHWLVLVETGSLAGAIPTGTR